MKSIKRGMYILFALFFVTALAACGGKGGGAPAQNNESGASQSEQSESAAAPVKISAGKADVTVYKVGSDRLAFFVTGGCCEGVAPRGEYDEGSDMLWLAVGDDWETQVSMQTFYGNIGYRKGEEWVNYSSEYRTDIVVSKNVYLVEITNPGICGEVPFDGAYELRCTPYGGDNTEEMTVASGKAADILKTVTEEEFTAIRAGIYMQVEPKQKAQGDWAGKYLTDQWSDTQGYMEAEVSELGLLHFHVITAGMEKDFFGEEHDYDKASYDYGDYVSAQCDIGGQYVSASFHLSQDADGRTTVSFRYDDYSSGGAYFSGDFERIDALWRQAPDGYEDVDRYGLISASEPGDAQYFVPATDDYYIRCQNRYSYTADGVEYPCTYLELYSFDANGFVVDYKLKNVFENEAAASAVLRQMIAYGSEGCAVSGRAMYYTREYAFSRYDTKLSHAGYHHWLVGCHYAYDRYASDSEYFSYGYLSKPFTERDFDVSIDDIIFLRGVPSGEHYCVDTQNASLYTGLGEQELSLYVYDDYDGMVSGMGTVRFHGRSAEDVNYYSAWDSATDSYHWQVVVKEYTFGDEEAEVTEYRYNVEESALSSVTLDNYKSKTADATLTHRFDLTRVKN
ncbi:MAG: hypothetical protein IJU66_01425 [Oscillospiraceae bacterium]|nr:hypothetical protein [Oscillospiraceae bacterium]